MTESFLRGTNEGVYIALKVQPRASRNEVGEVMGQELKISVTAPPVDSAANEAVLEFLRKLLGCSKSAVVLIKGQTSRHKTVFVGGMSLTEVGSRLKRSA